MSTDYWYWASELKACSLSYIILIICLMLLFICMYILVGIYYWILLTDGRLLLDRDYPQRIQTGWSGFRGNIDSVYTDFSGRTFFFKVNT